MNAQEFFTWLTTSTGDVTTDLNAIEAYMKTDDFANLNNNRKAMVNYYHGFLTMYEESKKHDSLEPTMHLFGKRDDYKKGDVVVWKGDYPCITVIDRKSGDSWKSIYHTHDSLHFSNLRNANQDEIELLGEKEIHFL